MSDRIKCCAECSGSLANVKWGADYCSDRCKMKAYRRRKRGALPALPVHCEEGSLVHPPVVVEEWRGIGGFHTVLVPDSWADDVEKWLARWKKTGKIDTIDVILKLKPLMVACARSVDVSSLKAPSRAKHVRNTKPVKKRAVKPVKKGA